MALEKFHEDFAELQTGHARNADSVSFAYLESLSQRLRQPHYASNAILIEKAQVSLQKYQADLKQLSHDARELVEQIAVCAPEHVEAAEVLFEQCEFKKLQQLKVKLGQIQGFTEKLEVLRDLTGDINQQAEESSQQPVALSIDQELYQQEQDARTAAGHTAPRQKEIDELPELQSMKDFRESMKYFNIDKIVARAINQCPENPGPHNPQMLAVKSLICMRDLSPQYLRRFAGYIETMLWLEKNAAKLANSKARPQGAAKS